MRDDEAVYWVSMGHYETVAVGNWWYWVSRGHSCLYILQKVEIWTGVTDARLTHIWKIVLLSSLQSIRVELSLRNKIKIVMQKVFKSPSQPFSTRFIIDINIISSIDIINIVNIIHSRYQHRWTFLTRGLVEESYLVSDCLNNGVCHLTSHHITSKTVWIVVSFLPNVSL